MCHLIVTPCDIFPFTFMLGLQLDLCASIKQRQQPGDKNKFALQQQIKYLYVRGCMYYICLRVCVCVRDFFYASAGISQSRLNVCVDI